MTLLCCGEPKAQASEGGGCYICSIPAVPSAGDDLRRRPRQRRITERVSVLARQSGEAGTSMCVLFVDDEPLIVMVVEHALQDAGHAVMTAEHAPGAIRLIADHPEYFTCMVTDLRMPGHLNGIHLVEHMRERSRAMPIVLATGRPDMVACAWHQLHQVHLLEKPYPPTLLVATVERLLSGNPETTLQELSGSDLPRREGEIAYEAGVPRWQNPYVFGLQSHHAWSDGWASRKARGS